MSKLQGLGALFALLLLTVAFSVLSPEFFTLRTWGSIASFSATLGVASLGLTILMISGEFDLSVGSIAALCGMLFAMGIVKWNLSSYSMAVIVIFLGAALGFFNGLVTLTIGIPSFITTLGSMLVWRGAVLALSGGFSISLMDDRTGLLLWFGHRVFEGFYLSVFWWLGFASILAILMAFTSFGNHVFATGGDPAAARRMGVNTFRVKMICFTLCGTLSAVSGIALFSQLQDLSPTAGENYELYGIACAVIGGTLLTGGNGTLVGTVLGTLLLGVVQAGLVHVGIDSYWFRTFVGMLLIVAVILNSMQKRFAENTLREGLGA